MNRRITLLSIAILLLIGASLAFDDRFLSLHQTRHKPGFAIFVYAPTILFGVVGFVQVLRGRLWPGMAFALGLIATGVFHREVAGASYGNPGYMVPMGHIAAPVVSVLAYAVCFLGAWLFVRARNK